MTATTIRVQMAQRKDTAANWTSANPILLSGEIGYETDTKKFKIGNGSSNWNSLAYLPIPDGSGNLTITGNLEIGSTGSLTFEGSTADGFETTLAVTNPTADRTITLPDRSGTVITSGDTGTVTSTMLADGTIVNADISATAEIAVSKLANGTANQIITTDGTDVSWSSNLNLAGNATIQGDLTVNGTTTTIDTQTLLVEDKNIEMGVVATPTDVTADGGGITLRGTTNKTINWVDATGCWTSSENLDLAAGKSYFIDGAEVINGTSLGINITDSSLTSVGTLGSLTVADFVFAGTFIPDGSTAPSNGLYLPAVNTVAISTSSSERIRIGASGQIGLGGANYGTSGQVLTSAGSGAAPTWQTPAAGNTDKIEEGNSSAEVIDTGSDGRFVVTTEGSERLRVDSSGRVGIGDSLPDSTVTIKAAAATTPLKVSGPSSELLRCDQQGRFLVGTSTSTTVSAASYIGRTQIASSENAALALHGHSSGVPYGADIVFTRSRSASIGTNTIVQNGDQISRIWFAGANGTGYDLAASIGADIDGTPGASGDMPGRLVFSTTADGASSPTEQLRITSDRYVRLASGTNGIQFNGDTAAANALDDYEEGTWTPTVQFGGASVGIAGTFTGAYTKTGNVVTLAFRVQFSSKGTSTGAMTITGLPFSAGVVLDTISGFGYIHRLAALQTAGQLYLMSEGTIIYPKFAGYNNGNTTSLTDTDIADTTDLRGGIVYRV